MIQQVNDDIIILNFNRQCLSAKFDRLKLFLAMVNSHKQNYNVLHYRKLALTSM